MLGNLIHNKISCILKLEAILHAYLFSNDYSIYFSWILAENEWKHILPPLSAVNKIPCMIGTEKKPFSTCRKINLACSFIRPREKWKWENNMRKKKSSMLLSEVGACLNKDENWRQPKKKIQKFLRTRYTFPSFSFCHMKYKTYFRIVHVVNSAIEWKMMTFR